MPRIYKAYNPLKVELYKNIFYIFVLWISAFFLMVFLETLSILSYFGFFVLSFTTLFTSFFGRRIKVTSSGIQGENGVVRIIKDLPDDYTVFSNVSIYFDGKESETDLIIVGPKGVFVVENKNHLGVITGKEQDKNWVQFKETKNGGKYVNPFYNPTKQVKTHIYRLSGILKENGFHGWIQGAVYFSNPEAKVQAYAKSIPVLHNGKGIIDYIDNFKERTALTNEEQRLIIRAIKEQIILETKRIKETSKAKKRS